MRRVPSQRVMQAAVVAASIALVAFSVGAWSRLATRPKHRQGVPKVILALEPSQVRSIAVQSDGRHVVLTRSRDGSWSGPAGTPPEIAVLMASTEERLLHLRAYRSLRVDDSPSEYGLLRPQIILSVEDTQGTSRCVFFGAPTFTGGGFYARQDTDAEHIYLVPRETVRDLRSLLTGRVGDPPDNLRDEFNQLTEQQATEASWWLQQILDAGTPQPETAK